MPEQKPLLKFKLPQGRELEAYAVEKPDGTVVIRTKDELEKITQAQKSQTAKKTP